MRLALAVALLAAPAAAQPAPCAPRDAMAETLAERWGLAAHPFGR